MNALMCLVRKLVLSVISITLLVGCGTKGSTTYERVLMVGDSIVDSLTLHRAISAVCDADTDTTAADDAVRRFYRENHELCWLNDLGTLTDQVDSLLAYLERAGETGMPSSLFFIDDIKADRLLLDSLDFSTCDMHSLVSRLDYRLTKAFVRYSAWQRYGIVNPYRIFNRLDHPKYDESQTDYLTLYDIPTEVLDSDGLRHLARLAGTDSVAVFLEDAEPSTPLYRLLKSRLATAVGEERLRILINMERCRWRHPSGPEDDGKYVVVNIPSYELIAVCPDSLLEMRIVCGSSDTKTPLLHSEIKRMDVNPRWHVPYNVVKHEMADHAGDSAYFARNRYHIINRDTDQPQNPSLVTSDMLKSGRFRVYQEGGRGNALGRIIFRFDNPHSIFLHDTSSPGAFDRLDRRISHGCIRVQKPYKLAEFIMGDMKGEREEYLGKLRYSMEYNASLEAVGNTAADDDGKPSGPDPEMLVHSLKVNPRIPIFITYFTLFQSPVDSTLHTYPDVYGYDEALKSHVFF